jgi:parallel beta-helix repeat protein
MGTNNTKIAKNNTTENRLAGILLGVSSNNTVYENNIANNGIGIYLLDHSSNNTIYGNNITDNDYGIWLLSDSSNNTISGNNITASGWHGIHFYYFSNNFIFHNSFVDNTNQVYMEGSANIWDDGYPSGGNYWSDYSGVEASGDGIGDTPYVIDADNRARNSARAYNLIVLLENLWEPTPEVFRKLLDRVGSSRLKICLDTGHANIFSKVPVREWFDQLNQDIPYVHVSDNKGEVDDELIPGDGTIDWHEFTNIFKDHQVNPEIVLEVGTLEKTRQSLKYLQTQNIYPFNIDRKDYQKGKKQSRQHHTETL